MRRKHDGYLNSEFTLRGEWWLPGKEETKVAGVIEYKPYDNIELTTIGSTQLLRLAPGSIAKVELVIGFTEDGKYCYLLNNQVLSANSVHSVDCLVTHRYLSQYVISTNLKATWKKAQDITFGRMFVGFHFLSEWIDLGFPIQSKLIKNTDGQVTGRASLLKYPTVDKYQIPYIDSELRITYRGNQENNSNANSNADMSTGMTLSSFVEIKPNQYMDIEWYIENFHRLNQLLILLFGSNTYIKYIGARNKANTEAATLPLESNIFTLQAEYSNIANSSKNRFFVKYSNISNFGSLFSEWLEKYEKYKNPTNLFVTTVNDSSLYICLHSAIKFMAQSVRTSLKMENIYSVESNAKGTSIRIY